MRQAVLPSVSRETRARLTAFETLLRKWNPAINLVSRGSLADLQTRHVADSAQLLPISPPGAAHWVDLGSGGGFPGLVVAILAPDLRPGLSVTLVESDRRKAAFLSTVIRDLGLTASVVAERAETTPPLGGDVVSARALAPLDDLLGLVERHMAPDGVAILPKGAEADREIAEALASRLFRVQKIPSTTDPDGVILTIGELSSARG